MNGNVDIRVIVVGLTLMLLTGCTTPYTVAWGPAGAVGPVYSPRCESGSLEDTVDIRRTEVHGDQATLTTRSRQERMGMASAVLLSAAIGMAVVAFVTGPEGDEDASTGSNVAFALATTFVVGATATGFVAALDGDGLDRSDDATVAGPMFVPPPCAE